ncbi:MAG: cation:proton antiporter, partial [Magnetovibrio sp.]|nr:cation:proton antiporter [Magnetovibrio sp.]
LIPGRHLLGLVLTHSGHKELLAVYGFVLALGGAALFELVGMKGDLGALVVGILLAQHPKAKELSKTLLGFKDVFLVGFFLTIGLTGLPTWETTSVALVLLALLPLKVMLFIYLLTKFRLRAHGATYGALVLGNYSEFGLIVCAIAINAGWLQQDWLTVIAVALSASFILASPLNLFANALYTKYRTFLTALESTKRLPGDEDISLEGNRILVFGMGRVGRAAYDEMRSHVNDQILGIDMDENEVTKSTEGGRKVVLGDATDPEFWSRLDRSYHKVEMILLAMPHHAANINAATQVREFGYQGPIVATALFPEQEAHLKENGIDEVFNIYAEAGTGAASRMWSFMDSATRPNIK